MAIAREHGGYIALGPETDDKGNRRQGAIFILRLPADRVHADSSETHLPRLPGSGDSLWS